MNKYQSHVYVIPEDDRNRQIADGFVLHHQVKDSRIKVLTPAGGWLKVLDTYRDEYISKLREYAKAHVVMLIDFDDQVENRQTRFEEEIPKDCKERTFVVGSRYNPEKLKIELKMGFENIGDSLAGDCDANSTELWDHKQLQHNNPERMRLVRIVRPFLF
ncbi:MAG: hypothetical protein JXB10_14620 [Pirellulales bacterium]|nr:hypothetical protein [Pirellulales bacterium]